MQVKNWPLNEGNLDTAFFKFIGPPRLSPGNVASGDIIRLGGMILGEKESKNLDFSLLSHYKDTKYGDAYLVGFRGYTFENLPSGHLTGEMLIREDDYSVVSLKYTWEVLDASRNRSTEVLFHSSTWKADHVSKIISDTTTFKYEYTYSKEPTT